MYRWIAVLYGLFAGMAHATTSNVSSPVISTGSQSLETRLAFQWDDAASQDRRLRSRIHTDYGFNDWYGIRLIANQDKRDGDNLEHDSVTFENKFQLFELERDGWAGGFRLIYDRADGANKPDSVELRLLALLPVGRWEFRHNLGLTHDIGAESDSGLQPQTRWQATYKLESGERIGLEMFNRFGNLRRQSGFDAQSHQLGPVLKGRIADGLSYQTGMVFGLSEDAPDASAKLFLIKTF